MKKNKRIREKNDNFRFIKARGVTSTGYFYSFISAVLVSLIAI